MVLGNRYPSIPVPLTLPKCQYKLYVHNINMNYWYTCSGTIARLILSCILFNPKPLHRTVFPFLITHNTLFTLIYCHCIVKLHFHLINMESRHSPVRNHHSQNMKCTHCAMRWNVGAEMKRAKYSHTFRTVHGIWWVLVRKD